MSNNLKQKHIIKSAGLLSIGLLCLLNVIFFTTTIIYNTKTILAPAETREFSTQATLSAEPSDQEFYETAFKFIDQAEKNSNSGAVAMIVPHHLLAADIIARQYAAVVDAKYNTIVIIGPDHFNASKDKISTASEDWQTPYGVLEFDHDLATKLESELTVGSDSQILANEHAISSQAAFIKRTWPEAKILPLIVKSTVKIEDAEKLAMALADGLKDKKTLVIASLDFSHHATAASAIEQDKRTVEAITAGDAQSAYALAVDSPSTLYAVMRYADNRGAKFRLAANTNAALLLNQPNLENVTSYITGIFNPLPANIDNKPIAAAGPEIKMLFFGDMMLDRHVGDKIKKSGLDNLFSGLAINKDFFNGYDIISANLEGAVTDQGAHYKPDNAYDFAFAPELIDKLHGYNFNYFNIANNHLSDQGERGIIETDKNLQKTGFLFSGCADGQVGACSATTTVISGVKIGLAGFSAVFREPDHKAVAKMISELSSSTDLIIVNVHWGAEYGHQFSKIQQELGHIFADSGADIIIGHHPHVVQGMEVYKNKPIFYSLGNFIFDQYFSTDTQEELALTIGWKNNNLSLELMLMKSVSSAPRLMDEKEKAKFLEKYISWSSLDQEQKTQIKQGGLTL